MKKALALLLAISPALCLHPCACRGGAGQEADADATIGDVTGGDATGDDAAHGGGEGTAASGFTLVEVDPGASATLKLAVQACAGLHNGKRGGSVFVRMDANEQDWLDELELVPGSVVDAAGFLDGCVAAFPACVRYSYLDQQRLLPAILTVASALGAVPLDTGMTAACGDVVFDATVEFKDKNSPLLATRYVFEKYAGQTTGLAMLNPGYDTNDRNVSDPKLTRDMPPALVDFVFSQRLFTVFLVNGCTDSHPEKALLHDIVNAGLWPTPLGVYGYNNSWMLMGGYLHEAQTRCLDSRNMGAIPTETGNLSFFSTRRAPIRDASELERNAPEAIAYDPATTYVAFVIGDGDNVQYILGARKDWMRRRLAYCGQAGHACAPLTWSISPHMPRLAPDVLAWYYRSAKRTGRDYFILPPSGHLYAYPSSLNEADQARFVAATEQDARVLGVGGTVHWDWNGTWEYAEAQFLPRYARADGPIRGVFSVNVPYLFPAFTWWPEEQFHKVLVGKDGGETVVFRPRVWRGVDNDGDPFHLSPQKLAEELGGYPPGTVTWVYMTSDGGLDLDNSFNVLAGILPSHVRLVNADTAVRLVLEARLRSKPVVGK